MDLAVSQQNESGNSPDVAQPEDGRPIAIEARGLVKRFDGTLAVDGVDLEVRQGAIYGVLGPNGAGKTTTLRMLLGIIDPDAGVRRIFGHDHPHDIARLIGYLPEERGLYPTMKAIDAIAFMGALRGLPLDEGKKRGRELLERHDLAHAAERTIRQLSKGMAQTVQLLGTLVHQPRLVVLDEPFSGLDAINQGKLETMIRALADDGVTVIFSTHVIHHAERLCEGVAIIAGGKVPYAGSVEAARDRIPAQVRLETRAREGGWMEALPSDTRREGDFFYFPLPESGIEPLLRTLIEGDAGILSLSIERAGLHDAFVHIAGEAAARAMEADIMAEAS
ncbi:ABC transporter ATP-binding protein [Altererythrobacter lutimaris]|uniref:ATP-binding cassette domain-containing protein n=1 Tax=Altererythrobacter lutimaris TaxID=2743979 RepID=A0A850H7N0_9SPHN|nr:ATP-binding cassette domain-containing protein [Altererythrobacter lutimaris]NVE95274.1 ATP-binding cassette domain-containing protein [Altererythrobacter lutimaris]